MSKDEVAAVPKTFEEWRKQEGKNSTDTRSDYRSYLEQDIFEFWFSLQWNDGKFLEMLNEAS